jgi:hypothetical protein
MVGALVIVLLGSLGAADPADDPADDPVDGPAEAPGLVAPAPTIPPLTPAPATPPRDPASDDDDDEDDDVDGDDSDAPPRSATTTAAPEAPKAPAVPAAKPPQGPRDPVGGDFEDEDSGDAARRRAAVNERVSADPVDTSPAVPRLPDEPARPSNRKRTPDPRPDGPIGDSPVTLGLATCAVGCLGAGVPLLASAICPYAACLSPVSALACTSVTAGAMDSTATTDEEAFTTGAIAGGGVIAGAALGTAVGAGAVAFAGCVNGGGGDCVLYAMVGGAVGAMVGAIVLGPPLGGIAVAAWKELDRAPTGESEASPSNQSKQPKQSKQSKQPKPSSTTTPAPVPIPPAPAAY